MIRALPWLVAAAALGGALVLHQPVQAQRADAEQRDDLVAVPPSSELRWMSLSYREALADLIWVRALVFSGANLGHTSIDATDRYVEAITGLAPRFRRAYEWGGITAIYGGQGKITRDMVERAVAIHRAGLRQFPESHELLYALGMLLAHQVGSTPGYSEEEKKAYAAEGVEMIRRAAAFGADPLVRRYASTLVAEGATGQLAIQFLETQLAQAEDEEHRRLLRRKLAELGGKEAVVRIEAVRDEFEAERAEHAPYVPDTVWAVIRDEAAAPSRPVAGGP